MGLYQKHRPPTFDRVVGNKSLITTLKNTCKDTSKIPHAILFVGPTGCVDCDTEFLSPTGWKYISDWEKGQKVMQYNADGTSEFVKPLQYIKKPSKILQHIKTKYGIDQCLSLDHRFVYFRPKKGNKTYELPFSEVLKQNENAKGGFSGKIETVFTPIKQEGFYLTDEQLRVQTMFIADGYLSPDRQKGCVSVKKKRKIQRVEKLLKEANIEYDKYQGSGLKQGYRQFHFVPPMRTKVFGSDFYKCTKEQLSVIANESLYWDAEYGETRVYSTIKESIDFLQFAFASIGVRTSIYEDNRESRESENPCYTLSGTKRHFTSMEQSKSTNKIEASPYKTKDGFEYCFTVPSSYLVLRRNGSIFITGNCGKTTLARIVASELKCGVSNLIEIDTAVFNGIDTVREINKSSQFTPLGGGNRVFIIDECFSKGTQIETPNGKRSIEDFEIGDSVFSLSGNDTVLFKHINKVPIERVMFLKFNNGYSLYCSKDHLFFTKNGWVKACELQKENVLLPFDSQLMYDTNLQTKGNHYEKAKNTLLCDVWNDTHQTAKNNLLQFMFQQTERVETYRINTNGVSRMCHMQKSGALVFGQTGQVQYEDMLKNMWGQICSVEKDWKNKIRKAKRRTINTIESIFENRKRTGTLQDIIRKDDDKQSIKQPFIISQSKRNKKNKRDITHLARRTWWERTVDRPSNLISFFFGVAYGSCNKDRAITKGWFWFSNLLQSRYWKRKFEIGNRSGREHTQIEKLYTKRFEENRKTEFVRLESSTFYERGNNDEHFKGVIEDQERNQGFVTFYDLEVQKHPSYFANEIAVHNCQRMTADAQNAFLKILEDTPPHIYFILCTTNENSLIPTVRGRCSRYQVSLLSDNEMSVLLESVCKKEKQTLDKQVLEQIVKSAQGHPRNALTILEQVLATPEDKRLKVAERTQELEVEAIELCRALLKRKDWDVISKILKNLKDQDDPEGVRRLVLKYMSSTLLNKEDDQAGLVLECFEEPFYNGGFPLLINACYKVVKS